VLEDKCAKIATQCLIELAERFVEKQRLGLGQRSRA
jgi:hypothetical protein